MQGLKDSIAEKVKILVLPYFFQTLCPHNHFQKKMSSSMWWKWWNPSTEKL